MSKERMEDLLAALNDHGWHLVDQREYPRASADPFRLENDSVTWAIARASGPVIELEFDAFGDLGQRTDRLRDIRYCDAVGIDKRLYFFKRAKPEWRENVLKFVYALGESTKH